MLCRTVGRPTLRRPVYCCSPRSRRHEALSVVGEVEFQGAPNAPRWTEGRRTSGAIDGRVRQIVCRNMTVLPLPPSQIMDPVSGSNDGCQGRATSRMETESGLASTPVDSSSSNDLDEL